jgi:hypothetical protein
MGSTAWRPMLKCNDIVVMGNLPAHKVPGAKEVIEAFGATCTICGRIRRNLISTRKFILQGLE